MDSVPRPTGIPEFLADLWVRYVTTLRRGLRRDALSTLDSFIDRLESQPVHVRDDFCRWVCVEALDRRHGWQSWQDRDVPLQHPLTWRVMRPYFEAAYRRRQMPALRWLYVYPDWELKREVVAAVDDTDASDSVTKTILDRAFSVAPGDPALWHLRFAYLVDALEYGSHHLNEGHGLVDGADEEYQDLVREARTVRDTAPAGALQPEDLGDFALQERLYQDWFDYVAVDAAEPFVDWCAHRGRNYHFPTAYYYGGS